MHTHQNQAENKLANICYQNLHTNVDSGAVITKHQNKNMFIYK